MLYKVPKIDLEMTRNFLVSHYNMIFLRVFMFIKHFNDESSKAMGLALKRHEVFRVLIYHFFPRI